MMLVAVPASGGDGGAARKLDGRGCPSYRAPVEKGYSREELGAARRWRFKVYKDLHARLRPPVDWSRNPHGRRGFRAALQTLQFLDVLFHAYERGRNGALRQAKALALDWVRSNPGPADSESSLAWFNKTVGERAPYLAFAVRAAACEGMLGPAQARTLLAAVQRHGSWLSDPGNYYPSNHGLFMDIGLLVLADHYFPFLDGAGGWERLARNRFPRTMAGRISREGAWLEHSAGYHFLVMDLAERFLELGGGNERIRHLRARLARAAPWFVSPDGRLTQLGDTSLDRAPRPVRRRARDRRGMKVMRQAGLAFVRRGGSYLSLAAGFHNSSHKQSDELTFELFDDGTRIVVGPGKYGFDRDRKRRYVVAARSHSVLTADGRDFARDSRLAYGSGIVRARRRGGWYSIVARNPLLRRHGVEHVRGFLFRPDQALVIEDRVEARRPHAYKRFLQLGPEVEVRRAGPSELELQGGRFRGCVEDSRIGKRLPGRRLVRGRRHPYQGWTFPEVARAVPRWSVSYRSQGRRVRHLLAIDLDGGCGGRDVVEQVEDEIVDQGEGLLDRLFPLFPPPDQPG
jgi:hypothetical protein